MKFDPQKCVMYRGKNPLPRAACHQHRGVDLLICLFNSAECSLHLGDNVSP